MSDEYKVIHGYGQLPTPDKRFCKRPGGAEPVITWREGVKVVNGWPTDEAIKRETEKVTR